MWTVVVGGLAAAALLVALRINEPPAGLSTFSTRFLGIFLEAIPFLLLGSIVSGLIEAFVRKDVLLRLIPRNPVLAAIAGTALGFVVPVCECGVVPVTRRLYSKGMPVSVGVAFLLASPVMNPIVLASTWMAFGVGPVLIGRYLITALVAVGIGLVFAVVRPGEVLHPGSGRAVPNSTGPIWDEDQAARASRSDRLHVALSLASDEFFDMGRYLVVGTLLAAGMQTLISQEAMVSLGRGPAVSVVAMSALAYVLSVCSTVDAFIALAFTGTFTTGAVLTFLTFGPMVDVKSTLMFLGVFKPKAVAYLVVLPLLMTLAIGIWINLNLAL